MCCFCFNTACRQSNLPITLDEISEISNVTKKEIGRTYRFIARKLNIKLTPISPAVYIPRFASELELSDESQAKAIKIIKPIY